MISFLYQAIRSSITLLFGATGEIITEKSGHLNLGVPGVMCLGGLGGCVGVSVYNNIAGGTDNMSAALILLFAVLFAFVFAGIAGAIYCYLTVSLRANQNITGLSLTYFGFGMCKMFISSTTLYSAVSPKIQRFLPYEALGDFGKLFFSYGFIAYLAVAIAIVVSIFLKRTRIGLNLRAVGENPATADSAGINVVAYKYIATIIGCGIAGLGGMYYMLDYSSGQGLQEAVAIVEALGWLSVALVIFVLWKPNFAIIGAFVFSCCSLLSSVVNTVPTAILDMLPYIITIIVLIITSIFGSKNVQPPASLGLNYFREDR
ncbi:MAG: ABC transporter permease [Elusimicrobiaceae bacterium]|nr:ABC transporter permease [Elusimicrobiaceae bacterium]